MSPSFIFSELSNSTNRFLKPCVSVKKKAMNFKPVGPKSPLDSVKSNPNNLKANLGCEK